MNARMEETVRTAKKNQPERMVKPSLKSLKGKKKGQEVDIVTPPNNEIPSLDELDSDASYLSICCLLQTESEASSRLVTESQILSKMLDKLSSGTPRDIEQLTLGAIANALTWIPSEIVEVLIRQGLVEYCHQLVLRNIERAAGTRSPDKAAEIALDILRDLVQLEDHVGAWLLDQISTYVSLVIACPASYPSVSVKRSCARLIDSLVESNPAAFVPGLPESRLTTEAMQGLFSLCQCPDLETSCYITMSGLTLEQTFGSSVIPTSANIGIDFVALTNNLIVEACTFTVDPTEEEELRLNQWRSKVRGVSVFIERIADTVEEMLSDSIAREYSIEEKRFFLQSTVKDAPIEFSLVDKFAGCEVILDTIVRLETLMASAGGDADEEGGEPTVASKSPMSVILEDRDVENIFELVSNAVKIEKLKRLRFDSRIDNSVILFVSKLLGVLVRTDADFTLSIATVAECLDTISSFLLSVLSGRNQQTSEFLTSTNLVEFVNVILKKIMKESIASVDNSHIVTDDQDEEVGKMTSIASEIIQLVYALAVADSAVKTQCAECLVLALSSLTEQTITASASCALIEAVFVVFAETDQDSVLGSIDWVAILASVAVFLKGRLSVTDKDRRDYVNGTIENIKAFVQYKKSQ